MKKKLIIDNDKFEPEKFGFKWDHYEYKRRYKDKLLNKFYTWYLQPCEDDGYTLYHYDMLDGVEDTIFCYNGKIFTNAFFKQLVEFIIK